LTGTIKHSDGERLILDVQVHDARGVQWFDRTYQSLASKYAYEPGIPKDIDPFQTTYKQIADDMLYVRKELTDEDIYAIRTTAEMKFARDFAPDAFSTHVVETDPGEFVINRLPAEDDPMLTRVRKVREREYLFIDTLDEYFSNFQTQMSEPYQNWRSATYDQTIAMRQLRAQARARTIAGAAAVVGGIAAQGADDPFASYGGAVTIIGGAALLKSGFSKRAEAQIHAEVLQELGTSAEAEITPYTIELENESLRLQGSVDAQYEELRRILRTIYFNEIGVALPEVEGEGEDSGESASNNAARDSNAARDVTSIDDAT
ncbi:MAG: hypothetical protein O7H39_14250, partial [Gammaproteobacteria bacterium]|nr:hypothetical protein [Gammaproteobacteria bacterium]